jgi:hypothetical protein
MERQVILKERHAEACRRAFLDIAAPALSAARLEQFRLERLHELRAVIESLRSGRSAPSPQACETRGPNTSQ